MKNKYSLPMLEAIKELRKYYQDLLDGKKVFMFSCVLCKATMEGGTDIIYNCNKCPWVIETELQCFSQPKNIFYKYTLLALRTGIDSDSNPSPSVLKTPPEEILEKWRKKRIEELDKLIEENQYYE